MKLYNTLTGQKEDFTAADGKVKMYVCGITPYAPSHLGHAMSSVIFDVIRRYLEFKGFKVEHVQNITDIDDKMIQAATQQSMPIEELAERNITTYLTDMDALNVQRAHAYPRATQEMPKILEMVQGLLDRGFAYSVNGSVYFRVRRDEDYGKLSHRSLDGMKAGARVQVGEEKEDIMDFALWKSQKPGEPVWESPWGPGRPGWHIECSAMSMGYLGETVDIHGGGLDLVFPHHENEIAQSESYSNKTPFARFWVHHGLLSLGESKMSKSMGNLVTAAEALENYSPDTLRLLFLSSHYRSPLTYNEEAVLAHERALERLQNALKDEGSAGKGNPLAVHSTRDQFVEAMDDDLNTPRALAVLFDLAKEVNRGRKEGMDVSAAQATLKEMAGVLGLTLQEPADTSAMDIAPFIELLIDTRLRLRAAKHYELADQIRDRLSQLGIILEDTPQGTEWKIGRT